MNAKTFGPSEQLHFANKKYSACLRSVFRLVNSEQKLGCRFGRGGLQVCRGGRMETRSSLHEYAGQADRCNDPIRSVPPTPVGATAVDRHILSLYSQTLFSRKHRQSPQDTLDLQALQDVRFRAKVPGIMASTPNSIGLLDVLSRRRLRVRAFQVSRGLNQRTAR